jgi:formylglycine-generating enzyme required for sulfatase activity
MSISIQFQSILLALCLSFFSVSYAGEIKLPIGITMVDIPAGSFAMGTCKYPINATCLAGESDVDAFNHETPQHRVSVPAFQMGKTEVTLKQFKQFIAATGRAALMNTLFKDTNRFGDDAPVVMVSWNDAQDFIAWLNKSQGGGYRLPSEAEWEYACRAGGRSPYCGGANAVYSAWYSGNSDNHQQAVAKKQANAYGLYDMSGNAWEWVQDCWHDSYVAAPDHGESWSTQCHANERVRRGGSWYGYAEYTVAAYRSSDHPTLRNPYIGFRVARSIRPQTK